MPQNTHKFAPAHPITVYAGLVVQLHSFGATQTWVVSFTLRLLHLGEEVQDALNCRLNVLESQCGCFGENIASLQAMKPLFLDTTSRRLVHQRD